MSRSRLPRVDAAASTPPQPGSRKRSRRQLAHRLIVLLQPHQVVWVECAPLREQRAQPGRLGDVGGVPRRIEVAIGIGAGREEQSTASRSPRLRGGVPAPIPGALAPSGAFGSAPRSSSSLKTSGWPNSTAEECARLPQGRASAMRPDRCPECPARSRGRRARRDHQVMAAPASSRRAVSTSPRTLQNGPVQAPGRSAESRRRHSRGRNEGRAVKCMDIGASVEQEATTSRAEAATARCSGVLPDRSTR